MSTATFSKPLDTYYEKPNLLVDAGRRMFEAAGLMEELNQKVRNGK